MVYYNLLRTKILVRLERRAIRW